MAHINDLKKEIEEKYGVLPKGIVEDIYKRAGEREVRRINWLKGRDERSKMFDSFGGFHFNSYEDVLQLKMRKQFLTRFIFVCTNMNYNNKVVFGKAKGEEKLAKEKDLQEILMLSEAETRRTKKALIENNLIIIEKDKTILVNKKFAVRGEIEERILLRSVKIMRDGVQEIYKEAKPTEHTKLALLFELLPYVNFKHNIICRKPKEEDITKVEAFTLYELAQLFNVNQTRLKNELFKIKVGGEDAVGLFTRSNSVHIYINPRIYYKGNDKENYCWVSQAFKVKQ